MTTSHDTNTNKTTSGLREPSTYLKDLTNWAAGITLAAINMRVDERLMGEASLLWEASVELTEAPRWSTADRRAVLLQIEALLLQPEALVWVAQQVRTRMLMIEAADAHSPVESPDDGTDLELDPSEELAPLAGEVTPVAHVPVAVQHVIDETNLDLLPDGCLEVTRSGGQLIAFYGCEVYALATFLRMPAVAALLEAQEVARQTDQEGEQEASMAEEAARMAAR